MPAPTATTEVTAAPLRPPLLVIIAAWLIPGSGHFLLGKRGRGAIVFAAVLVSFVLGILMHGPFFAPAGNGDVLTKLIQWGGFIGDISSGLLYLVASFFGYNPPDQPGHAADYGSKFLVGAGLLNILAMVDAYEIATRQKD
jgi:hypothetical protein